MDYKTEIVTLCARFDQLVENAPSVVVVDVENRGEFPQSPDAALLGVAIAFRVKEEITAFYVALCEWDAGSQALRPVAEDGLVNRVSSLLAERELIGHNSEHDCIWLDHWLGLETRWKMDTRKAWHLSDDQDSLHGFGLKTAQVQILGWPMDNEGPVLDAIEDAGGNSKADLYLVPLDILGRYAALDAASTLLLAEHLIPFFDRNNYWDFLKWRMGYHKILTEATRIGTTVDFEKLLSAKESLAVKCEELRIEIRNVCSLEVEELENQWAWEEANTRKTEKGRTRYLDNPEKWVRFNPNSPHHRTALFHGSLGIPVSERTPTGRPKQDRETIAQINHPVAKAFVEYSESADTLEKANSYISALGDDGRIHFPYNNCATVSDRLGGYKPYALNMPFSEAELMSCFVIPEGFIGIHADLSAIEPCLIAAYSEDPTLMKFHKDGLGDVYLDFALDVFPDNSELHNLYNPFVPLDGEVKKRFTKERDICKTVKLSLDYTATWRGIWHNLKNKGHEVSEAFAQKLVILFWTRFERVADFEFRLKKLHARNGHLRNIMGRIIRVPKSREKDTMNRFIQSGGHDILTEWVIGIDRYRTQQPELQMYPILPDIHDSTSWAVKEEHYEQAKRIYEDSLRELNQRLNLPVTIRAEIKPFRTFAGLKGNEI